jgi:hypothetical protein
VIILKKVVFNEYILNLKEKSSKLYNIMESEKEGHSSKISKKPRAPEEDYILFLLDYMRWQRALKSGAIVKIEQRRYKLDWTKRL